MKSILKDNKGSEGKNIQVFAIACDIDGMEANQFVRNNTVFQNDKYTTRFHLPQNVGKNAGIGDAGPSLKRRFEERFYYRNIDLTTEEQMFIDKNEFQEIQKETIREVFESAIKAANDIYAGNNCSEDVTVRIMILGAKDSNGGFTTIDDFLDYIGRTNVDENYKASFPSKKEQTLVKKAKGKE